MSDSGKTHQAALPSLQPVNRSATLNRVTVSAHPTANAARATSWADVRAIFRISPPDGSSWSMVEITRPHAVIGRKTGSDIAIGHPDLESLHTYLNLDENGCFAIDLRTGSGMRVNGRAVTHGRLVPGDTLEVGGFLIRLDGLLVNGKSLTRHDLGVSLLALNHTASLVGLALDAQGSKTRKWVITSAIAFLGSEPTCTVALPESPNISRIHSVFVRTAQNVFFIDLASRGSLLNGTRIYNECIELHHGDTLSVGGRALRVQLANLPQAPAYHQPPGERYANTHQPTVSAPSPDTQIMLAALLTQIQKQHDTALERQNEMQVAMAQLLRQVQNEQSRVMDKYLERLQTLDQEITSLKSRLGAQAVPSKKLEDIRTQPVTSFTPPPLEQPQSRPEPAPPASREMAKQAVELNTSSEYTAAWLMDRVSQLEQEQTSAWKEMLGRLLGR